ncbi:MAG: YifB family Mg chelatase-like AAA ATPase [Firmicutes bacterium]|nr:YifB family Mg chelatase-like AAA ATPase [Candidatus Fermentithermobacillaceae bacterium]
MFSSVFGATVSGLAGFPVIVETDVSGGLPCLEIVGMPDTSVKEAKHRVRSALRNSGFEVPSRRIVVNLAPAGVHKEGTQLDLAIALGLLAASREIPQNSLTQEYGFLGELALDGTIRPIPGVLAMALALLESGLKGAVVPLENCAEVAFLEQFHVLPASNINEVADFILGKKDLVQRSYLDSRSERDGRIDLSYDHIKGHQVAKRALEIAAAGEHNLLMVGPPGSGKSVLAKSLPEIMPDLSTEEAITVTKIHSIAGLLPNGSGLLKVRPFRSPHHTATMSAMIGGGTNPKPGEITLAHRGVLFLDELGEFSSSVINALRQPLEDGLVNITRAKGTYTFPCKVLLVGAMNPCLCGFYGSDLKECTCTEHQRRQYVSKIDGPLLDRIDMCINVERVELEELTDDSTHEAASTVKARVTSARERQRELLKQTGLMTNSEMGPKEISTLVTLSSDARKLLFYAYKSMKLSVRTYYKVIKVAASISDLANCPRIEEEHIAEAISYRQKVF